MRIERGGKKGRREEGKKGGTTERGEGQVGGLAIMWRFQKIRTLD